jgi:D-alanine-D-alanine ligase
LTDVASHSNRDQRRDRLVIVLYNCDYDNELTSVAGVDVSAVRAAALQITDAIGACGFVTELIGVHGDDVLDVIRGIKARRPALVFNVCESLAGDARNEIVVPAVLEMLGLPYTGASALTLGMSLHKERTKEVLAARGIATPDYRLLREERDLEAFDLDYPVFLKLAHEDASIGIEADNVCHDRDAVAARTRAMLERYRQPVIAERYIDGREVNVTLLGNGDELRALPLHEIDFAAMPEDRPRIVSYAAKWDETHVDYAGTKPVPMRDVSPALVATFERAATEAFRALELRDFGRVDLRVDANGVPWVIDVNPNCDLSPDAGFARSARAAGMAYPELIGEICEIAWRRYAKPATPA